MTDTQKKWKNVGGGEFPPAVKFTKAGQQVEGLFISMHEAESDKFESGKCTFIEMEVVNSNMSVEPGKYSLMGHGLLVHLITNAEIKEGDEVRITYNGKQEYKKGKKTREGCNYTLETTAV